MVEKIREKYEITYREKARYVDFGKTELSFLLNDTRFHRLIDCNNKFKKHLGFTLETLRLPSENLIPTYRVHVMIHDKKKLMLFRIKYGL